MRKLSQKELLEEGIGSALAGIGRVAGQAVRGAAKALAPAAADALGKGASLAAGAIQNIRSGSPVADVKAFLKSEEGKRLFKNGDVKFGKEQKLPNNDVKIPITGGIYLADQGGGNIEEKDLNGGFIIVRPTQLPGGQGFKNDILEVHDSNGKLNNLPLGSKQKDSKPTATKEPVAKEPAQKTPEGNFDGNTGLPLTPKGAELFKKQPEEQRQKTLEDAKKLGFGIDPETGIQAKLEDIPQTEEPAAEEPKAEEPKAEEPKAEEPATDKLATPSFDAKQSQEAFNALKVPGFKRERQHMDAIKSLKKYLETQTGKNHPDQTLADRLRSSTNKGRVSIKGVNFNRDALRKILESKNSQKNLLKLLHSGSRMNKWVIGR